jgi:AraC family transcriptional regulator of adaptative response/methylated-DNA-[protein]-cysteine methyltransferase
MFEFDMMRGGSGGTTVASKGAMSSEADRWRAVVERYPAAGDAFVYGVSSTGIFCRPTCPSRRPRRDRVSFFDSAETARDYADARRSERVRRRLRRGDDLLAATYGSGYGSSNRLYEQAPQQLGMTPGRFRSGGRGERLRYTVVPSPLGRLLVAATERGLCRVALGRSVRELEDLLRRELPAAERVRDESVLRPWVEALLGYLVGDLPLPDLPLDVRATAFQRRVWQALRAIPRGETLSYSEIARRIRNPRAVRAVAGACAANPVALVVPCHRGVRKNGSDGGYRWGTERKRALLDLESPPREPRRTGR